MRPVISLLLSIVMIVPGFAAEPQAKRAKTAAAAPARAALTVDWIMKGPALYGNAPRAVRWSADSKLAYFQWKPANEPLEKDWDTYEVKRDGSGLRKLTEDEAKKLPSGGSESKDHRWLVTSERGDLVLFDQVSGTRRQLTKTSEAEASPRLTLDGKKVTFTRGGNLYALTLADGYLEQLTDIRAAGAAAPAAAPAAGGGRGGEFRGAQAAMAAGGSGEAKGNASQEQLKKEERALLDVIERRAKKREEEEAKRKQESPRKPWTLQARQSAGQLQLSPDGTVVLAGVMEGAADAKTTNVPNYVTESAYTEQIPSRTKVGDAQGRSRMALVSVATGEVVWLEHGQKMKQGEREVERPVSLMNGQFSEDGKLVVAGRSTDNKDRWIFAADLKTGKLKEIFHLRDEAWVGGPGSQRLGWMPDGKSVYFQAEIDGWSHLYTVPFEGGKPVALTSGQWEVAQAELSRDEKQWYLHTSEASLHEQHFYAMAVGGGARTRITTLSGEDTAVPSPDGTRLAVLHSTTNTPTELYLMDLKAGAEMQRVTNSPTAEFTKYPWVDTPIVKIPARDGAQIPAHLLKPEGWKKGGPAVMFVHGAGYLQNVTKGWSSYAHEYLFSHLLMEKGYLVIDIDYRGSAGYGRDWRTGIYRYMGGKDLEDHVDAAKWLVAEHGVDPKRIGLFGGSYGGFITLMALFTAPDVFAAGAALRPVTDWAHYNHPYTANILNAPQGDLEAYKKSSPIYHAAGLKGALLICHGVVDTNVHFQDTVRLVQRLIELRKENWEVALFPVEDHGFVQETSWADEYKRILKLFEANLKK